MKNMARWQSATVEVAYRGQEFVAEPKNGDPRAVAWLRTLFKSVFSAAFNFRVAPTSF